MPVYEQIAGEKLKQLSLADRNTGEDIYDDAHLRNSIVDILTTPLGSRVMRRDYGSNLFRVIDEPINRFLALKVYSAVAEPLRKWEPRIKLKRVKLDQVIFAEGSMVLDLYGKYILEGREFTLKGLKLNFRNIETYG